MFRLNTRTYYGVREIAHQLGAENEVSSVLMPGADGYEFGSKHGFPCSSNDIIIVSQRFPSAASMTIVGIAVCPVMPASHWKSMPTAPSPSERYKATSV